MNTQAELNSLWQSILMVQDSSAREFNDNLHDLFENLYSFLETLVDKLEDLEDKIDKITESVYPQS